MRWHLYRSTLMAAWLCCCAPLLAGPASPGGLVTLNFVNADLETVIRAIGEMTGRNFMIDPRVKGTINILSAQPVSRALAYQILLSSLRLQGFSAVEGVGVIKILPESDAKLHARYDRQHHADGERLITRVFKLKNSSVNQLMPVIRPLVSPNNVVAAFAQGNALVITDYAESIILAVEGGAEDRLVLIPLRYASALELAATVSKVLQDSGSDGIKTQVSADARANVLLVRTDTDGRLSLVKRLVLQLDQPSQAGGNARVVYLKNADAGRVAQTLRALLSSSAAPLSRTRMQEAGLSPSAAALADSGRGEDSSQLPSASAQAAGGLAGNLIQADSASNALILNLPDPMYRNLRHVIDQLDRRRAQVYVETLVIEVSARRLLEMGVEWQSLAGLAQDGTHLVGSSRLAAAAAAEQPGFASFAHQGLNIGVSRGAMTIPGLGPVLNLAMLARALETGAQGNVLSNPTLMATDNERARIEVGQEISIQTGQYASSGSSSTVQPFSTYERKKVGFKLEIVPQIAEGGSIRMKILQEASALAPGTVSALAAPVTTIRAVETAVTVDDGGMIAIGGLIQETLSDHQHKVPVLGDIPWLGWLFKYRYQERKKTNLLVFLRPTIVRDALGARAIAEDRYRYIIGESQKQVGQPLPLAVGDVLKGFAHVPGAPGPVAVPAVVP